MHINQINKPTTILYPGGFKPLTSGHIDLIFRYLEHPRVDKIVIIIGKTSRDFIDQDAAYTYAYTLLKNIKNIEIIKSEDSSAMTTVYKYMENCEQGIYCLGHSNKDNDYNKENRFYSLLSTGGKFNRINVEVEKIYISQDPFLIDNKPVSATNIRNFIINNDFNSYLNSYSSVLSKLKVDKATLQHLFNFLYKIYNHDK